MRPSWPLRWEASRLEAMVSRLTFREDSPWFVKLVSERRMQIGSGLAVSIRERCQLSQLQVPVDLDLACVESSQLKAKSFDSAYENQPYAADVWSFGQRSWRLRGGRWAGWGTRNNEKKVATKERWSRAERSGGVVEPKSEQGKSTK